MAECDGVGSKSGNNFINGAPAVAAAQVAAMAGLFLEQPKTRLVVVVGPIDTAGTQPLTERLNGPQELTLFDGEGAHGKLYWRAFGEPQ